MDQAGSSAGYQGVIESNNHQDFSCRGVFLEKRQGEWEIEGERILEMGWVWGTNAAARPINRVGFFQSRGSEAVRGFSK